MTLRFIWAYLKSTWFGIVVCLMAGLPLALVSVLLIVISNQVSGDTVNYIVEGFGTVAFHFSFIDIVLLVVIFGGTIFLSWVGYDYFDWEVPIPYGSMRAKAEKGKPVKAITVIGYLLGHIVIALIAGFLYVFIEHIAGFEYGGFLIVIRCVMAIMFFFQVITFIVQTCSFCWYGEICPKCHSVCSYFDTGKEWQQNFDRTTSTTRNYDYTAGKYSVNGHDVTVIGNKAFTTEVNEKGTRHNYETKCIKCGHVSSRHWDNVSDRSSTVY